MREDYRNSYHPFEDLGVVYSPAFVQNYDVISTTRWNLHPPYDATWIWGMARG